MSAAVRFRRTEDDASEILTVCVLESGRTCYSELLEGESPYVIQITSGPDVGDDFIGLYDLDGERLDTNSQFTGNSFAWEIAEDVPADVATAIQSGWEWGTSTVTRLSE